MRGALRAIEDRQETRGIIPAYAGSTGVDGKMWPWYEDHPRVCGEHTAASMGLSGEAGSSPRMRGALMSCTVPTLCYRIIPAYAGSTGSYEARVYMQQDHPRVCGEHTEACGMKTLSRGSSPRMRGARAPARLAISLSGIIPAYAGSTKRAEARRDELIRQGIIPAYAGSTTTSLALQRLPWDHPRVCGEHGFRRWCLHLFAGSSPRMRGAHQQGRSGQARGRIIPAYAGSTKCKGAGVRRVQDHPRVCGEHYGRFRHVHLGRGSSPRMRGAPSFQPPWTRPPRIIPAYAGST